MTTAKISLYYILKCFLRFNAFILMLFVSLPYVSILSMLSTFPLCIFFIFSISFFLWDHNGNKAVQPFCSIPVATDFLTVFRNPITIL